MVTVEINGVEAELPATFEFENTSPAIITIVTSDVTSSTPIGKTPIGFADVIPRDKFVPVNGTTELHIRPVIDVPGIYQEVLQIGSSYLILTNALNTEEDYVYSTLSSLQRRYGKLNINKWADLDGDLNPNSINLVTYQALYDASRQLDSLLSSGFYHAPFARPFPALIEQMVCAKAAHILYMTRGLYDESTDKTMSSREKQFQWLLNRLNTGAIRLEGTRTMNVTQTAPFTAE